MAITRHIDRGRLADRLVMCCGRWPGVLAGLAALGAAQAQTLHVQPSIASTVVLTNNVDQSSGATVRSDQVFSVAPQLQLTGSGAGYQLDGGVGATAVYYASNSLSNRLLPRAHLGLKSRIVDRLFFVETRLDADTTVVDPFLASSTGTTTYNHQMLTRLRLSPYIDRAISPLTHLTARSDNTFTRVGNADAGLVGSNFVTPGNTSYVQSDLLRWERRPTPLGVQLEGTRLDSRLDQGGGRSEVENDTLRSVLLYSPDPQWQLGARYGHDLVRYSTVQISQGFTGGGVRWVPSTRTSLDANVENRFFGHAWTANLLHRAKFFSVSAGLSRQLTSYAQSLAALPTAGSTATMLNEVYRASIPDDAKRGQVIQDLIAKYHLPDATSGPLTIYSNQPQLQQAANLNLMLTGVRDTVSLTVFDSRTYDLPGSENVTGLPGRSVQQRGWTVAANRRLTPTLRLEGSLGVVHAEDLGLLGRITDTRSIKAGLVQKLSPRTDGTGGVRYNWAGSSVLPVGSEFSVYAGMTHRF